MTDPVEQRPDQGDDPVLHFREGLPGFPEARRFVLVEEVEDGAFQLLQSVDDPDIAFVVTVPWAFFPDYAPEISDLEASELGITDPSDAVVLCPVTLDGDQERIFVNLLGPIVVNPKNHEGRQLVLTDSDHPVRAAVDLGGV